MTPEVRLWTVPGIGGNHLGIISFQERCIFRSTWSMWKIITFLFRKLRITNKWWKTKGFTGPQERIPLTQENVLVFASSLIFTRCRFSSISLFRTFTMNLEGKSLSFSWSIYFFIDLKRPNALTGQQVKTLRFLMILLFVFWLFLNGARNSMNSLVCGIWCFWGSNWNCFTRYVCKGFSADRPLRLSLDYSLAPSCLRICLRNTPSSDSGRCMNKHMATHVWAGTHFLYKCPKIKKYLYGFCNNEYRKGFWKIVKYSIAQYPYQQLTKTRLGL